MLLDSLHDSRHTFQLDLCTIIVINYYAISEHQWDAVRAGEGGGDAAGVPALDCSLQ